VLSKSLWWRGSFNWRKIAKALTDTEFAIAAENGVIGNFEANLPIIRLSGNCWSVLRR